VERVTNLSILSESEQAGVYIVAAKDGRQFFITGHSEYDRETLAQEYFRDRDKGLPIEAPVNYFPHDNPANRPVFTWKAHSNLLFSNWLNYFVYEATPYDLEQL
jgi:homoserine O-succinyltransferase